LIDVDAVLVLLAGEVIATTRLTPVTVIAFVSDPNTFVQTTVMVFAPSAIVTELVAGVVEVTPLTVQVTGAVPVTE